MRSWLLIAAVLCAGCAAKEKVVSTDLEFDGTCVSCHTGLSAGQVHPTYKLRCVDCHGGDDQVAHAVDEKDYDQRPEGRVGVGVEQQRNQP